MEVFFKEGDLVSHQGLGNGTVISINNSSKSYPISVQFSDEKRNFTLDGKYIDNDLFPSLLQGHNRFIAQPNKPIFEPKEGDMVWGKFLGSWFVGYYKWKDTALKPVVCISTEDDTLEFHCSEIRPFKGEIPND